MSTSMTHRNERNGQPVIRAAPAWVENHPAWYSGLALPYSSASMESNVNRTR